MKTEDLISLLAADGKSRGPKLALRLLWAALGAGAVAGGLFLPALGLRPDLAAAAGEWRFVLKLAVGLGFALSGAMLALRLARPVPSGSGALLWLLPAPVLLALASVYELAAMPSDSWAALAMGHNGPACLIGISLLSALPLGGALWAMREGAPDSPAQAGAAAGAVAAGIGAALYALHCPDDSPLFLAFWYTLAAGIVILSGRLGGARLLRW